MKWRWPVAVALAALGAGAAWQLLVVGHIPGMVLAGGLGGAAAGLVVGGRRWAVAGGGLGLAAAMAYFVAWLFLDLPPRVAWMEL